MLANAERGESDRALLHPAATGRHQLTMRPACCNYFDDNVFIRKSAVGLMFVRSSLSIESLVVQAHDVRLGTSAKEQQRQFLCVIATMQCMLTRTWRSGRFLSDLDLAPLNYSSLLSGCVRPRQASFGRRSSYQVAVRNDYRLSVH